MEHTTAAARGTVTNRSGSSRKLLVRKAAERVAGAEPFGPALEDAFPGGGEQAAEQAQPKAADTPLVEYIEPAHSAAVEAPGDEPAAALLGTSSAPPEAAPPAAAPAPAPAPSWSESDEAALQALIAQRRAAGYQRRGRDVCGQRLRVGDITPNAGTVVAVIAAAVAEHGGIVMRGALLDVLADATFPDVKTTPSRSWLQGYVAGAVRDGFLALAAPDPANTAQDASL